MKYFRKKGTQNHPPDYLYPLLETKVKKIKGSRKKIGRKK
tara:strand:+ start:1503 stop:1622 length:120 start_codon:yes stop_codon:yes gene_type:complete